MPPESQDGGPDASVNPIKQATQKAAQRLAAMNSEEAQAEGSTETPGKAAVAGQPQPLKGKVTIDFGGTPREVDAEELARAFLERDEARQMKVTAEKLIQDKAAFDAMKQVINQMDQDEKQAFGEVLKNPRLLKKLLAQDGGGQPNGEEDDEFDPEEAVAAATGRKGKQTPPQSPREAELLRRIDTLEQANQLALRWIQDQENSRREENRKEQIQKVMAKFPVFRESPPGADLARKSISRELAADPNADLEASVAAHAADLHKILRGLRPQSGEGHGPGVQPLPEPEPARKATAKDLLNGGIRRNALRRMSSF